MGMILQYEDREYEGTTAAEIVRAMARAATAAEGGDVSVRAFVLGALERLADSVHPREFAPVTHLSDEAIAFNFLCLLDEYGIARFTASAVGPGAP
jgi:hypothetical protein